MCELLGDQSPGLDTALRTWYYNIRAHGGMRLRDQGYQAFTKAGIENWQWRQNQSKLSTNANLMLALDRKLHWPYYLDRKSNSIVFFSSKEAMLASIYGDLDSFLKNYA